MRPDFQLRPTLLVAVAAIALAATPALGETAKEKRDAGKITPQEIILEAQRISRFQGAEMIVSLTVINPAGQKRIYKTAGVSKLFNNDETEKRLLRFIIPAENKGMGMLTFDHTSKADDIWLYLPQQRKTRRVISSSKTSSFMGSEFTYADMTPPSPDEYNWKILDKKAKVGGVECWRLESIPKTEDIAETIGYSKKNIWIDKNFLIRQTHYYDLSGDLIKKLAAKDIRELDKKAHRFRPMILHMSNVQNKRQTILKTEKFKLRRDIPDSYFTTRYLERP